MCDESKENKENKANKICRRRCLSRLLKRGRGRKRKGCNKEERREKRKANKVEGVNEEDKGEKGEELVKLEESTLLLGSRLFLL